MIAALYMDGKVVTGSHHGDAYSKLSENEKNSAMTSGFLDPSNFKFVSDDYEFYLKKIIMLRHGDSQGQIDSPITEKGRNQAQKIATFLHSTGVQDYTLWCSPIRRCVETAKIVSDTCNIGFIIEEKLSSKTEDEDIISFINRLQKVLESLPEKSLLVSHCDFIKNMAQLVSHVATPEFIPNCSMTFIDNNRLIWLCREINDAS